MGRFLVSLSLKLEDIEQLRLTLHAYSVDRMGDVFDRLDIHEHNYLTNQDLMSVLSLKENVPAPLLHNGKLEFGEFMDMMSPVMPPHERLHSDESEEEKETIETLVEMAKEVILSEILLYNRLIQEKQFIRAK